MALVTWDMIDFTKAKMCAKCNVASIFRYLALYDWEDNKLVSREEDNILSGLTLDQINRSTNYCFQCLNNGVISSNDKPPKNKEDKPLPIDYMSLLKWKGFPRCSKCLKEPGLRYMTIQLTRPHSVPGWGDEKVLITQDNFTSFRISSLEKAELLCWNCSGLMTELQRWRGMDTTGRISIESVKRQAIEALGKKSSL